MADQRTILLCPSSYFPHWGGVEELTKNLAVSLVKRGHRPVIATNKHPSDLPSFEMMDGIPVHRFDFIYPARSRDLPTRIIRGVNTFNAFNNFLTEQSPSVMHIICAGPNAFYSWLARKPPAQTTVVSFCGELFMDSTQIYQRSKFYLWALNRLLERTDVVSGVSQYVLDDANARLDIAKIPQKVLYPAIRIAEYVKPPVVPSMLPECGRFILAVGRFVENKGFEELIRAFYNAKLSDLTLIVAGRGPLYSHYIDICKELDAESRIIILNEVDRDVVLNLYDLCDFFVIPSQNEPFALATLEAMRAHKAVIATTGGGTKEIIHHGENGLLYTSGNVEELAEALRRLALNDGERFKMGKSAGISVSSFDWSTRIDDYLALYQMAK